jgi:2,6-dihydroxypseudooxynicotine hydrolase
MVTAVSELMTAARCYHLAYFLSVSDPDMHHRGLHKMVECHDRALPHDRPRATKVEIPFEGSNLLGLFSVPEGVDLPPVVIVLPGLDSTKETRHGGRGGLLRRGMAVLSLDGPGQGEMSLRTTIRPDYEVAVGAAIDWLEARSDVDAGRVGVNGASLGGYYAARAAAFEPRVKATVENCGPFDWGECFDDLPYVTREAYRHYSGATDMVQAREMASALTMKGATISSPFYIIHGEVDPLIPAEDARRLAAICTGEVVLNVVPNGNHGVNNLRYLAAPAANDWLAERLRAGS